MMLNEIAKLLVEVADNVPTFVPPILTTDPFEIPAERDMLPLVSSPNKSEARKSLLLTDNDAPA